jgi:hypothetical protein
MSVASVAGRSMNKAAQNTATETALEAVTTLNLRIAPDRTAEKSSEV